MAEIGAVVGLWGLVFLLRGVSSRESAMGNPLLDVPYDERRHFWALVAIWVGAAGTCVGAVVLAVQYLVTRF